jgi:deoxyguanosine kinase
MAEPTTAYIGLGSNLGDREGFIQKALARLKAAAGIELSAVSDMIESPALGDKNQPEFINAVARIETTLSAEQLHRILCEIETSLGRGEKGKKTARTIDLDLLLFGRQVINSSRLTIPHPQMHLRSFVLSGLCQLDSKLYHPVIKESIEELMARLGGGDFAVNPDKPQLVSVAGIIGVGKTTLAKKLREILACQVLFEAYDTNPFLPAVYAGTKALALDSQLYFLTSRIAQLNPDKLARGRLVISDYVFDKELIYAGRLLDAQQLSLYRQIYPLSADKVTSPVLVVYLTDSSQNCLERIHSRNRSYEQKIDLSFLEALAGDYDRLFAGWKACPVIRFSMSEFDCRIDKNVRHLAEQIKFYTAG